MSEKTSDDSGPMVTLSEVLFILCRHKWLIVSCLVLGSLVALAFYLRSSSIYEYQAKLLVRYVMDTSALDPLDPKSEKSVGTPSENALNSEIEILGSWDLAESVVDAIGVDRLRPDPDVKWDRTEATRSILLNLKVTPPKGSNVITISFRDSRPEMAREVMDQLLRQYFGKHIDIHRSADAFEFVSKETEQVRQRLGQTEEDAKKLKAEAGIITLSGSISALDEEIAKNRLEVLANEVDRAEQKARIGQIEAQLEGAADGGKSLSGAVRIDDQGVFQKYQTLASRLGQLRQTELELLSKYTGESRIVRLHRAQIGEVEGQIRAIERQNPGIELRVPMNHSGSGGQPVSLAYERARLAGLEAKSSALQTQAETLKLQAATLSEVAPKIAALERKREVDEANYKYFGASLERTRIDEALDPSKIPNISVVQKPSPTLHQNSSTRKISTLLAGGGLFFGIFLSLVIDLGLDQTIKRPREVEGRLGISLMAALPYFKKPGLDGQLFLREREIGKNDDGGARSAADADPFIRAHTGAIRDRLLLLSSLRYKKHHPKFLAVTGVGAGVGGSTIASALAADFSEVGEGKVLVVDMNGNSLGKELATSRQPVQSFAVVSQATSPVDGESVAGTSYDGEEAAFGANSVRAMAKQFHDLVARFRSSDLEYVIFDLPSMQAAGTALAMAQSMDHVVLVLECEKTSRGELQRAYADIVAAGVPVSVVMNKIRNRAPKWLGNDF